MKNSKGLLLAVSLCLLFFPCAAMAQGGRAPDPNVSFKNLAGPPDEMPLMRLPAAETLGLRSKAATLPIRLRQDAAGNGVWSSNVPVDHTGEVKLTLLAPNSRDLQLFVTSDGVRTNLRHAALAESQSSEVRLDGVNFPAEVFTLRGAKAGSWKVDVVAAGRKVNAPVDAGFLVVSSDSPYRLYSYLDTRQTLTGRPLEFVAAVFDERAEAATGAKVPAALAGSVTGAQVEIRTPGGKTETINLNGADERHYAVSYVPREAGQYLAQVVVRGKGATGEEYVRTGEHVFQVLADNVKLGKRGGAAVVDQTRLRVSLPADGLNVGRKVIAYAEVWGRDGDGGESPVAWIGGMALAKEKKNSVNLDLMLDARWLARGAATGSYELRNVRVQDADYFVTLAESASIPLTIDNLPTAARAAATAEITDEMRMGKKPEAVTSAAADFSTQLVGGKLLLIHGYCAGGNPFPTSQFTDFAVFNDPNQNRTHDQFANLIRNFGAQFPSFGAVAHSQGGAASLHLYTYYWSGFDSATGNRLIQTVGTPYQGTALAGNLALLAQIFGGGCGSNTDLTYSGAANWLAGIPSWARARVHYSTTSFADVWWRYDYCNLATDPFLSDPDDGVVERTAGQLPGANNRGHKTGWCHTTSMRDPGQTTDAARNADMNANAAR